MLTAEKNICFGLSRNGTKYVRFDSERLDKSLSGSLGMPKRVDERRAILREVIKQRAQARGRGANPATKKRDLDYTTCTTVNMWLADTGCGYDLVSKRETASK